MGMSMPTSQGCESHRGTAAGACECLMTASSSIYHWVGIGVREPGEERRGKVPHALVRSCSWVERLEASEEHAVSPVFSVIRSIRRTRTQPQPHLPAMVFTVPLPETPSWLRILKNGRTKEKEVCCMFGTQWDRSVKWVLKIQQKTENSEP